MLYISIKYIYTQHGTVVCGSADWVWALPSNDIQQAEGSMLPKISLSIILEFKIGIQGSTVLQRDKLAGLMRRCWSASRA